MTKTKLIYNPGPPPRRGAWPVRSAPPAQPNSGWRYWDGERWGQLCSSRAFCLQVKCSGRNTPLKWPVLWGKAQPTGVVTNSEKDEIIAALRLRNEWLQDKVKKATTWEHLTSELIQHVMVNQGMYWIAVSGSKVPVIAKYWSRGPEFIVDDSSISSEQVTHVIPINTPPMP